MILWILAIILMGTLGLVGYYQGAIRATISLIGLIFATFLAIPLAPLARPILRLFGFEHPMTLAFITPIIMYIIILAAFKGGALALHKKVDTYYKYKVSDTERMLFERLNERLGVCIGLANALVYLIAICVIAYPLGYFTTQVSTPENAAFSVKMCNLVAEDLQSTKMSKAVAGLVPATAKYYDAVDILGDLYSNPLLQSRLASYPPFLALTEKSEFKDLAKDSKFQEQFWLKKNPRPSLGDFLNHEKLKPMVGSVEFFTNIVGILNNDFVDLKTYIETGKSPKYDSEKLLGYWYYDFPATFKKARRAKLNMAPIEIKRVRQILGGFTNSVLTAYVDNSLTLNVPQTNRAPALVLKGTWKNNGADIYDVTLKESGHQVDVPTTLDGSKLIMKKDNFALVFER